MNVNGVEILTCTSPHGAEACAQLLAQPIAPHWYLGRPSSRSCKMSGPLASVYFLFFRPWKRLGAESLPAFCIRIAMRCWKEQFGSQSHMPIIVTFWPRLSTSTPREVHELRQFPSAVVAKVEGLCGCYWVIPTSTPRVDRRPEDDKARIA